MSPRNAGSTMLLWGLCLSELGEFDRAEEPLREAHRRLASAGVRGDQMGAVLSALASVYDHTGRPDEAARWRAELTALSTSTRPSTRPVGPS
jgi:hypothetical protein